MPTSTMLGTSEENIITTEENAETAEQTNPIAEQNTSNVPLVKGEEGLPATPASDELAWQAGGFADALSSSPAEYPANQENTDELSPTPEPAKNESPAIEPAQGVSANPEPEPLPSSTELGQTTSTTTESPIKETTAEQSAAAPTLEQPTEPADAINEPIVHAPPSASPEIKAEEKSVPPPSDNTNYANEQTTPIQINEEKIFLAKLASNLAIARQKRKQLQTDNLEKILGRFSGADKITNNKVEDLLKVSNRTAARYLGTLFKQGKIMKFGKTKSIFYQKYS